MYLCCVFWYNDNGKAVIFFLGMDEANYKNVRKDTKFSCKIILRYGRSKI